jgi:hypothetical protein
MSVNSLVWYMSFDIGGLICGIVCSLYAHYNLKFLLDQRLATIPQHHWVSKFLGLNFSIEYKPGRTNVVADALSRHDTEQGVVHTLSSPNFDIMASIRKANISYPTLVALKDQIIAGMLGESWALMD